MLEELIVTNLGLIEAASIEPSAGLVVVTGETGTGKTLLLGALGLAAGDTARRDVVGPHGDEAEVQARFSIGGAEQVVVRRVSRQGRSKAYLNGTMATARELTEAAAAAVEIVGQHDHLRLVSGRHVRQVIDGSFDAAAATASNEYRQAYDAWQTLVAQAGALGGDRHGLERELEMVRFQADEIAAAALAAGEDDELAAAANARRNAAAIGEALATAITRLGDDGIEPQIDDVLLALERAASLDPGLASLAKQAFEVASLLGELRTEVNTAAAELGSDPQTLDDIERRLAQIGDLKRKYGNSAADVVAFGEAAAARSGELHALLENAGEIENALRTAEKRVRSAGRVLSTHRQRIADGIASAARSHLGDLGFTDPKLDFVLTASEPGPHGSDRAEIRFASSADLEAKPVSRIASGGELSRLVLAIRLAAGSADGAVAAFDEIDAGVGGAVALALGRKLSALAAERQVLCVTHLPQVAAFADTHVVVSRSGDVTSVRTVDGDERVEELSRMLAGLPDSEQGRGHAAELLAAAGQAES